jgi:UPF0716 protein FxsA
MLSKLIVIFITVPLVEIYFLIKMGQLFGAFHTVALVILTAILGAYFARLEGLRTLERIQLQLMNNHMPAEELMDAILIFVAGVLLLTPGFLTDAAGFWVLIPITRSQVKRWLRRQFDRHLQKRSMSIEINL